MNTTKNFITSVLEIRVLLILSVLLLLAAMPAFAQQTKEQTNSMQKRERIEITFIKVKPEMVMDFETLIKTDVNPALAKGGAKWNDVWQTAVFGDEFEYVIVAPVENYAQYDGPSPMVKGMGKDIDAFYAKASKTLIGMRTVVYDVRQDLSYSPEMSAAPKMAVISLISVAPARNSEFENFLKTEFLPIIKKSGIRGYWTHQLAFGGDVNQYLIVALHENFAEVDKGHPVARVVGQDGMMKLMQKLPAGVVLRQERLIYRFSPELSYRPSTSATK
jgi:hypothetical protein